MPHWNQAAYDHPAPDVKTEAHPSQIVHAMDDAMLRRVFDYSPVDPADISKLQWEQTETGRWSPYVEGDYPANVDYLEIVEDPVYGYFCVLVSGTSEAEYSLFNDAVAFAQRYYASNAGL